MVIFPGSFNPFHDGHKRMLDYAKRALPYQPILEISLLNRDKDRITPVTAARRIAQIKQMGVRDPVVVTELPLFIDKARAFPGAIFLVGADTLARIDPEEVPLLNAREVKFMVFPRNGKGWKVGPQGLRIMKAQMIPGRISSTEIRRETDARRQQLHT